MLSFREYLDREAERRKKHVQHHNNTKALEDAFPGEELDKAKDVIYDGKDKKKAWRSFIKKPNWGKLWSKVRDAAGKEAE